MSTNERTSMSRKLRTARLERTVAIVCCLVVTTGTIVQYWMH